MRHTFLVLAATLAAALRGHAVAPDLTLSAEPAAGVAPLIALISGAHRTVDLTMYELKDTRVQQALVAAAHRGVHVRVLLDRAYSGARANAAAFAYLGGHGVPVRWAPSFNSITHQKTLTVDGAESVVMTLNLDGENASTRDFYVVDRRAADVGAVEAAFAADWAGRRITAGRGSGDLVWSPGATPTVMSLITGARKSIDLESEEMDYAPATAALCAAARRGVSVRIVMTYSSEWKSAFNQLIGCGVAVRLYHGQRYYIHAKLLEVDAARVLIGSQNLSRESLGYNRELGILVTEPALLSTMSADFGADFAGATPWTGTAR